MLEHTFRFLIPCSSRGRLISGARYRRVTTAASELLLSEEPAALPPLAQPLHRLVKDRHRGSGRRPRGGVGRVTQELLSASSNTPTPSASDTPARPAERLETRCVFGLSCDINKTFVGHVCVLEMFYMD